MKPNIAYLSLGSNIDPAPNLERAVRLLAELTRLRAISSVWETKPVGLHEQPNFLNAAAVVQTELTARQLKHKVLQTIEQQLGRVRLADKNGPRSIDIDVVLFNNQVLELGLRRIPDPEVLERAFVAIPLAELAPNYRHPETGQTLRKIAARFNRVASEMAPRPDVTDKLRLILPS